MDTSEEPCRALFAYLSDFVSCVMNCVVNAMAESRNKTQGPKSLYT